MGSSCRQSLEKYAEMDLLGSFIVKVHNELLPICAIPISNLSGKCVRIFFQDKFLIILNIINLFVLYFYLNDDIKMILQMLVIYKIHFKPTNALWG